MKAIPYILSAILLLVAWLFPFHKMPWTTFGSEVLTFLSALVLLSTFINKSLNIPKPQLLILPILAIPLIQWGFGQVLYFSNALLCTAYIGMFWLMVVVGYNLGVGEKRHGFPSLNAFPNLQELSGWHKNRRRMRSVNQ